MTSRTRNLAIIAFVAALAALALMVIIPGSPLSKKTRLGLDLRGGVELVYEGRPTPKVPKVTPEAINDAIETIRKRTDALGVSEPEIQAAGQNQISIGLPAVANAERAEEQVGTTAQLQFYDWEPNVLGNPNAPVPSLFEAVDQASKASPKAEADDIPPGGASAQVKSRTGGNQSQIREFYDRQNDSGGRKYYLFGPGKAQTRQVIRPGQVDASNPQGTSARNDATAFYSSCKEIQDDFETSAPTGGKTARNGGEAAKGTACPATLKALGKNGPKAGSIVVAVPRGIVVVKGEPPPNLPATAQFNQYWVLEDDSELSGSDIKDPKQAFDPQTNEPIVTMEFTDQGRKAFARVTKRIADRGAQQIAPPGTPRDQTFQRFSITLDNQIVSLATINYIENPEGIDGSTGAQINGIGDIQQTQDLAESLRIGALPIELKLISKTQVSATLGQQALDQGLLAAGVGLALTLLFLIFFYRVLGMVAAVTLLIYALLLFAVVKLIPITLTLPGIAGLILTLGVAADANIVIFERIKEEARSGRSIPASIATGYQKALRTIIDANVVTIGVAFILFMLATAGVKGFAFTLGVGTIISLLTAVLATSAILGAMGRTKLLRSKWALNPGQRDRQRFKIDFVGKGKYFFSASGLILVVGALAIAGMGVKFGIDFESGTRITTPVERPASVQQVRDTLQPLGYDDAKIQEVKDPELGGNIVQISTRTLGPDGVQKVQDALDQRFGVNRAEFSASSIGPTFGQQIAKTALIAVIASLVLISLYIGLRFEAKFAVPVLIALAHDLLITAGVYALVGREVTTSTVAALLTILGYSLYDTIIVFDRIRENVPRMPRATFSQIVNRSMAEVFTRSLVTSFSTLMPVAALMLFGGETLRDFGFALLVGVASGTYSSIFIAAPVLTEWKEREPVYKRRRRMQMEEHGGVVPPFADGAAGGSAAGEPEQRPQQPTRAERLARRSAAAARPVGARAGAAQAPAPAVTREQPPAEADAADAGNGAPPEPSAPAEPAREPKASKTKRHKKHGRR